MKSWARVFLAEGTGCAKAVGRGEPVKGFQRGVVFRFERCKDHPEAFPRMRVRPKTRVPITSLTGSCRDPTWPIPWWVFR